MHLNLLFEFHKIMKKEISKIKKIQIANKERRKYLILFYIRKVCHLIPLMFQVKNFREIHTREYDGEIIVAIVFFTTQKKIFEKINILHKRFLKEIDKDA